MATLQETPGDRRGNVLAACICSIAVSTVALLLRLWSRTIATHTSFWWDDFLAIVAWGFAVANCGIVIYWVHIGLGLHLDTALGNGASLPAILVPFFAGDFLYNTAISAVKLSAIFFYARVFRVINWYKMVLYVVGGLAVAWWITYNVLAICTCIPVRKAWDTSIPGHCLNQETTFIAAAAPNVAIDLMILLLPMPLLWQLRLSLGRKLGLIGVFALGYSCVGIAIARLVTVVSYSNSNGQKDPTWNWVTSQILVIIEPPLGIVSICVPSYFALLLGLRKHGVGSLFTLRKNSDPGLQKMDTFSPITSGLSVTPAPTVDTTR